MKINTCTPTNTERFPHAVGVLCLLCTPLLQCTNAYGDGVKESRLITNDKSIKLDNKSWKNINKLNRLQNIGSRDISISTKADLKKFKLNKINKTKNTNKVYKNKTKLAAKTNGFFLFRKITSVLKRFAKRPSLYYKKFDNYKMRGVCSYYSNSLHGSSTATMIPYTKYAYTAASRTLPLMSVAKVRNLKNNREATVMITDRGPFKGQRILDVSYVVAADLGFIDAGLALVEVEFDKQSTIKLFNNDEQYFANFYQKNRNAVYRG